MDHNIDSMRTDGCSASKSNTIMLSAKNSPVYSNNHLQTQSFFTSSLFLCFKTHKHLTLSRRDQANENGWYNAADII